MDYDEVVSYIRDWLNLRALPGHYSRVLAEQLVVTHVGRTISTFAVLDEIGKLQGTWQGTSLGRPEQFKHKPLLGLWKQHYFQASFMFRNLGNEAKSPASKQAFEKIADALNSGSDVGEGIHELVMGGYARRAANAALIGEWIVYAKDGAGQNFFLTLAKHLECTPNSGESKQDWQRRSDAIVYE